MSLAEAERDNKGFELNFGSNKSFVYASDFKKVSAYQHEVMSNKRVTFIFHGFAAYTFKIMEKPVIYSQEWWGTIDGKEAVLNLKVEFDSKKSKKKKAATLNDGDQGDVDLKEGGHKEGDHKDGDQKVAVLKDGDQKVAVHKDGDQKVAVLKDGDQKDGNQENGNQEKGDQENGDQESANLDEED